MRILGIVCMIVSTIVFAACAVAMLLTVVAGPGSARTDWTFIGSTTLLILLTGTHAWFVGFSLPIYRQPSAPTPDWVLDSNEKKRPAYAIPKAARVVGVVLCFLFGIFSLLSVFGGIALLAEAIGQGSSTAATAGLIFVVLLAYLGSSFFYCIKTVVAAMPNK